MSGFSTDLLTGLAVYLAAGGLGATWSPNGTYTALQTGIVLGTVPQTPDRIITLTSYAVDDAPALSDSTLGVQVRCRWNGADPRPVDDLADAIFTLLHGKTGLTLGSGASAVTVVQCLRNSAVTFGQDTNGRWSNAQNFYLHVHRPSTNRT